MRRGCKSPREAAARREHLALDPHYPGSSHVVLEGLQAASDADVWHYARAHDFVLVSKDDDFVAMSNLLGRPPCLIKLSLGNCSNDRILTALLSGHPTISNEFGNAKTSMVELVAGPR